MAEEQKEDASGLGATDHDKKMIENAGKDIVDQVAESNAQTSKANVPDWIPDKYKGADDPVQAFLDGHKNLEQKLGGDENRDDPTNSKGEETVPEDSEDTTVTPNPLEKFHAEYADKGELSPDSYKELEGLGFNKDLVDTHIRGIKLEMAEVLKDAHTIVGGEEEYTAMVAWAVDTLSETEVDSYNEQLAGDKSQWELALRGMHDKYLNSGEAPVSRIRSGEKPEVKGVQPFLNQDEVKIAMMDKRYKKEASFRQAVTERLAISDPAIMGASLHEPIARHG